MSYNDPPLFQQNEATRKLNLQKNHRFEIFENNLFPSLICKNPYCNYDIQCNTAN